MFADFSNLNRVVFCHQGVHIDAGRFYTDVASLTAYLSRSSSQRWLLCYEDSYRFSVALFAVLHAKRQPILLPNNKPGMIKHFKKEYDAVLSDDTFLEACTTGLSREVPRLAKLDDSQAIVLFTSGSTGEPKKIIRTLDHLMSEITVLEELFGDEVKSKPVYSTVFHQHLYGLLFYILWPIKAGRPIYCPSLLYPEQVSRAIKDSYQEFKGTILITTPSLLKRLSCLTWNKPGLTVFSSGGLLSETTAKQIDQSLGVYPIEVFGSTETSGVAYRQQRSKNQVWTPLPRVNVDIDDETNRIKIRSPFFEAENGFLMGDLAKQQGEGFLLMGRADRIAKIEEKRVSLTEIENHLKQSDLISEAVTIVLNSNRQCTVAIIVLTKKGMKQLVSEGKVKLNKCFQQQLCQYFDRTVIPKKFRYVKEIPINSQGKYVHHDLKELFNKSSIRDPKVLDLEQVSNEKAIVTIEVGKEIVYFRGHFPGSPVLPGIVQTDWVIKFACHIFNIEKFNIQKIAQLKFNRVIQPGANLFIELIWKNNTLTFKYYDAESAYSSGKLTVKRVKDS